MSTTFIEGLKVRAGRTKSATIHDVLAYVKNPLKTENGRWITTHACISDTAAEEMEFLQDAYEQKTGKRVDGGLKQNGNILISLRQSFSPGEVDAQTAHEIGCKLAQQFIGDNFQYVVTTHVNSHCIHNHIIFNAVGNDLVKYPLKKWTYQKLREVGDSLSKEYNLTIVVPSPKRRSRLYSGHSLNASFRTILQNDIDRCMRQVHSYDELLQLMSKDYYVKANGKHLSFRNKSNGQQRNIRAYTLGEAYTETALRQRVQNGGFFDPAVESNRPITFSRMLHDSVDRLQLVGLMRELQISRFGDFESKITELSVSANGVQTEMQAIEADSQKLEQLLRHMETLERYGELKTEYQRSLLPERFYAAHRDELDAYASAEKELAAAGTPASASADVEKRLDELQEKFQPLYQRFMDTEKKIAQLNHAAREISRAFAQTEKGGIQQNDR